MAAAVERFVAGLELDDAGRVIAEAAFVLAAKLDGARASDTAAAAGAAPALARQLVDAVSALRPNGEVPDAVDELKRRRAARRLANATSQPERTA